MHLLAVLLLQMAQPAAPPPDLTEIRAILEKRFAQLELAINRFDGFFEKRFAVDADKPQTGMMVRDADSPGPDGLHAVEVTTVLRGGPAAKAGVQSGDRILAIGPRKLEHEPTHIVRMLLDDATGSVTLTLRREDRDFQVTLLREPVACLRKAADSVDMPFWHRHIGGLREGMASIRSSMNDPRLATAEGYAGMMEQLNLTHGLLNELVEVLGMELSLVTIEHCGSQL